jgi:hypothetical protein
MRRISYIPRDYFPTIPKIIRLWRYTMNRIFP